MLYSEDPVKRIYPKKLEDMTEEEQNQAFFQWKEKDDLRIRMLEDLSEKEGNLFTYFLEEAGEELQNLFAEENHTAFLKFVKEKAILAARLEKEQ